MTTNSQPKRPHAVKYNPAFLSEDDLVRSFVVRGLDHDLILDVIRDNDTVPNQHILVVGPRGSGKTSLLRRVTISAKRDEELGQRWFPLVFAEESYQVTSAGEFWLEAIFHLAEQRDDPSLRRSHQELARESDDDRLRDRALALLLDFSDSVNKRLQLVVENLHMLVDQISDDDAWKLRHTLQNEHRIMFMASATTRFEAIDNAGKAFYDLFRVHELRPLTMEECHDVWVATSGKQPPLGSIRPVQILTGGNLRLMTIISQFGAERSFKALLTDLMLLVDEHTEYFKSHLDALPSTERKIYLALAELWAPATARQAGEVARLDVHRGSALLGRLVKRGAVTVVDIDGKKKYYQLTERLYNVYYLMRRRGSPSHRVKAAVSFMVGYYGPKEIVGMIADVARDACDPGNVFRAEHICAYQQILDHPDIEPYREEILRVTPELFFREPGIPTSLKELASAMKAEETGAGYSLASPLRKRRGGTPDGDTRGTAELSTEIANLAPQQLAAICGAAETVDGWCLVGQLLSEHLQRHDDAVGAYRKAIERQPTHAAAWSGMLRLAAQGAIPIADVLGSIEIVLRTSPNDPAMLNSIAWALFEHGRPDLYERAESWARAAVELAPDDPHVAPTHASILCVLGRVDEALVAAGRYLEHTNDVQRTLKDAVWLFTEFSARGATEQALTLLRGSPSASILEAVIVALELDAGLRRAAPHEIVEVAEDIRFDIHARRAALGAD